MFQESWNYKTLDLHDLENVRILALPAGFAGYPGVIAVPSSLTDHLSPPLQANHSAGTISNVCRNLISPSTERNDGEKKEKRENWRKKTEKKNIVAIFSAFSDSSEMNF